MGFQSLACCSIAEIRLISPNVTTPSSMSLRANAWPSVLIDASSCCETAALHEVVSLAAKFWKPNRCYIIDRALIAFQWCVLAVLIDMEGCIMSRLFLSAHSLVAIVLSVLTLLATEAHAGKVIEWNNLLPQVAPLKDPFNVLTQDQRFDIETIIWARGMSDEERALEHNRQPIEDAAKYEREFKKAGSNVDKLVKDQKAFEAEVARRASLVNNSLNGSNVRIAGYLLPLEFSEKGEKDFLLVPYVGACVHVPPPPANQMVLISLSKKMVVKDLYTPVWISGQMKTKQSSKALNLVDGTRNVTVGYHIDAAKAEIYKDK
jgi:hypothetical protein